MDTTETEATPTTPAPPPADRPGTTINLPAPVTNVTVTPPDQHVTVTGFQGLTMTVGIVVGLLVAAMFTFLLPTASGESSADYWRHEFTMTPLRDCPHGIGFGTGCQEWTSCINTEPLKAKQYEFVKSTVVAGVSGPQLVCEWKEKR